MNEKEAQMVESENNLIPKCDIFRIESREQRRLDEANRIITKFAKQRQASGVLRDCQVPL